MTASCKFSPYAACALPSVVSDVRGTIEQRDRLAAAAEWEARHTRPPEQASQPPKPGDEKEGSSLISREGVSFQLEIADGGLRASNRQLPGTVVIHSF